MNVSEFVVNTLQKKYPIDPSTNLETFNYVESGYVDSLGIIQFITEIEDHFSIVFSNEEIASPAFQIVGELISIIELKLQEK